MKARAARGELAALGAPLASIGAAEVARVDLARMVELEPQAPDVPNIEARLAKLALASKTTLH
jgi:regulator of sirC expression with transglutaminase-like and TPR domain